MSTELTPDRSPVPGVALQEFWQKAMSAIKGRVGQPTMWRAMEQLQPLVFDEDTVVFGLGTSVAYHASQLTSMDRRNAIDTVLSEMAGHRITFRIIEGDSIEDWLAAKERDQVIQSREQARRETKDRDKVYEDAWEAVSEEVYRIYSRIPLKQLPQSKAAFFTQVLPVLKRARRRLLAGESADSEVNQRAFARLLDKVATLADLSAVWIACKVQEPD
ncbi:MAG: hypothetical protein GYA63_06740 [Armatimonadetes bacterium]|jgi:hypothetical protein|nr:hypothetical protein [Armatimonadota bacterium]HOC30782.1 hypothetical protein [Armatimonadota bacterium]